MHPYVLFNGVELINTGVLENANSTPILKEALAGTHPDNFIGDEIILSIFSVKIKYLTRYGNLKESEKFMVLKERECDAFDKASTMCIKYMEKHGITFLKVQGVSHICDAALYIG